ncbi:DUF3795 domain-containing protein [Chloroflexota bacterium]
MSIREIGCCGAYCKTCRTSSTGSACRGCKLGYESGERDINKAKCKIKLCCFRDRGFETCANCEDYPSCDIIHTFHDKSGTKYRKYKQAIDFIREHGYYEFLNSADGWTSPYGKLP